MLCKHMESSQHWNKFPTLEPIFSKKEVKLKSSVSFCELSIQSKEKYKLNPQCKHHKPEVRAMVGFKSSASFCVRSF